MKGVSVSFLSPTPGSFLGPTPVTRPVYWLGLGGGPHSASCMGHLNIIVVCIPQLDASTTTCVQHMVAVAREEVELGAER